MDLENVGDGMENFGPVFSEEECKPVICGGTVQRKRVNSWGHRRYGFCFINSRLEPGTTDWRGNKRELGFRKQPRYTDNGTHHGSSTDKGT